MSRPDYLFVYGTLRANYNLGLKDKVARYMVYVERAKVNASLYDLGRYPGAVKEGGTTEVIGDVFLISNPGIVFEVLDDYEGKHFTRSREVVKMRSGKTAEAWVYWYNQKPDAKRKIRYKDYLNYLKSKKTA